MKPILSILLLSLILASCLSLLLPQVYAEVFTEKRNPSATEGEQGAFTDPELAYVSDDQRASAYVFSPKRQTYFDFQFNLANIKQVNVVNITIEGYAVGASDLSFRAKVYNGSTWSGYKAFPLTATETNVTMDYSTALSWGEQQVNSLQVYIYAIDDSMPCTVYVDQILATIQYESAHGAAGGPTEDDWVPLTIPNIPLFVKRFLEWLQQMIQEHRAVLGLGFIIVLAVAITKKKPPKQPSWLKT